MEKEAHSFGPTDGLNFAFEFLGSDAEKGPLFGRLSAWIGGSLIWGTEEDQGHAVRGVEWYWQDLLRYLAEVLHIITFEEVYPLGLEPMAPQLLRQAAAERWYGFGEQRIEEEEEALIAFEECHDLAHAAPGLALPMLFVLREGAEMIAASKHGVRYRSASEVIECLTSVAEFLASRAEQSSSVECRAIADQWRARPASSQSRERTAELVSALPRDRLRKIAGDSALDEFWNLPDFAPNRNAYLIAARMTSGVLSDADIRDLLGKLKIAADDSVGRPRSAISLADISAEASNRLRSSRQAYNQGYELGAWLRQRLGIAAAARVEVQDTLSQLGVATWEVELTNDVIDAVLMWRELRPPIIILNKGGKRSHFPKGKRASLAHELCHLLIDRDGAFPAIEVQGGRLPRRPEQRANAFAAEFLLPRSAIVNAARKNQSVASLLDYLSDTFDVSHELAAWQVLNSELSLNRTENALVKSYTYNSGLA